MKIGRLTFPLVAALLVACSVCADAQQPPEVRTVYISEIAAPASLTDSLTEEERKIGEAAVSIIELRLNSMKELQVKRSPAPCPSQDKRQQESSVQLSERAQGPPTSASEVIYEVVTSLKMSSVPNRGSDSKELLLQYDLFKYVQCKRVTIAHREDPISLKTAFQGLLQMGDVLEVTLKDDLALMKTTVAVVDISAGESQQVLKDFLVNNLLIKLASEPDFNVRDLRANKPPDSLADYLVTGKLISKDQKKGVEFLVENVKAKKKPETVFEPGPVGQKNPDEKALARFYEKASQRVINSIRAQRDSIGPPADSEVPSILERASKLLCKDQPANSSCEPQPESAIPMLARLRDYEKATARALALLGDAYENVEEHQKAADSYDQAWAKLPAGSTEPESVLWLTKAAEALYKAQNYSTAADRYQQVIDISVKRQLPVTADQFVQVVRSRKFANERITALKTAIEGLRRFPDSQNLDAELRGITAGLTGDEAMEGYQLLSAANTLPNVAERLNDLKGPLAERLGAEAAKSLMEERDLDKVEKNIKLIESLGVDSLPKSTRDYYTLVRALWVREAKNDFAAAISSLEPLVVTDDWLIAYLSKVWLADTLYHRARRAGSAADRKDYIRAVELLKEAKVDDYTSYSLLLAVNNMLDANDDSRQFLGTGKDPETLQALAVLCLEYMNDLPCAEKNLAEIPDNPSDDNRKLIQFSLALAKGQYEAADKLTSDAHLMEPAPPALFYRVWTLFALDRQPEAQAAATLWQEKMEKFRGFRPPPYWVFGAATKTLETDQKISARNKELLKQMIASMNDPTLPVLKVADFFPAVRPTRK